MATSDENINKVQEAYQDYKDFLRSDKWKYAANAVRTIVEIIVSSYMEYYEPNAKSNGLQMDLHECINKLNDNSEFMHNQIAFLHKLRIVGNAGSHQALKISKFELENARGAIEEVISVWMAWCKKENIPQRNPLKPATLNISVAKLIGTIGTLVFAFLITIYLTYEYSLSIVIEAPKAPTTGGWKIYAGFIVCMIVVAYYRHYSFVHRIISDVGFTYFVVPRIIAIIKIICSSNGSNNAVIRYVVAVVIFAIIYLVMCRASKYEIEPETISGYKY